MNGTCTFSQPKIDECNRKIDDAECKSKIFECKSQIKTAAEKVQSATKKLESIRAEEQKQLNDNKKLVSSIPEKCKQMRLKRRRKRSSF